MKNILFVFFLIFGVAAFAQNPQKENIKSLKITQKKCNKKAGYQLVLKEVLSDSRCPEGVSCVWAGEISAVVSVYKDSRLIEDTTLVFSMKNNPDNIQWFANYLPEKQKKIKNISVFPYPKAGIKTNPAAYYIKIWYVK